MPTTQGLDLISRWLKRAAELNQTRDGMQRASVLMEAARELAEALKVPWDRAVAEADDA
jgi:predicted RNA-binding Zn ribbon-like protein